jgi:uncharacterized protein DUF4232
MTRGCSAAALVVLLGGLVVILTACATPDTARAVRAESRSPHGVPAGTASSGDGRRPGVFPSTPVEPPTDIDRPDGRSPTPDDELTAAELDALVRLEASAAAAPGRCSPGDVRLALSGIDAALGHRYSRIVATNVTHQSCTLVGWPGLGFRGGWGSAFPMIAERSTPRVGQANPQSADASRPVTLAPGGRAAAELEWTGALAGAQQEHVSLIAVQLSAAGPAAALPVAADHVDIGEDTTVRISWWRPA